MEPGWPARNRQIHNAFLNQLETPVLFYVLTILAWMTRHADYLFVVLAWIYVLDALQRRLALCGLPLLAGCSGGYTLQGKVIHGQTSSIELVHEMDVRLRSPGVFSWTGSIGISPRRPVSRDGSRSPPAWGGPR